MLKVRIFILTGEHGQPLEVRMNDPTERDGVRKSLGLKKRLN